jgi:biopolymer transport protein TolQ
MNQNFFALAGGLDLVVLYLLLLLSLVSIAVIIERFLTLKKIMEESRRIQQVLKKALETRQFSLIEKLRNQDLQSHQSHQGHQEVLLVESSPVEREISLEIRAISLVLDHHAAKGLDGLEELFNSFILSVRPTLEKHLNFLATIGSNAPYIGLLGTVLGIMKAFHDLASQSESGMQAVMAGISGALLATAAGLFVAIPAVMAYNYYQKKVKAILASIEMAKDLAVVFCKSKEN